MLWGTESLAISNVDETRMLKWMYGIIRKDRTSNEQIFHAQQRLLDTQLEVTSVSRIILGEQETKINLD